jgi:hypothetical protein
MYVDDDRRYVYCLVSKASCTSWKRTLLWMTGKDTVHDYRRLDDMPPGYVHNHRVQRSRAEENGRTWSKSEVGRLLQGGDYFKFAFFRDPIDRLVSAYRDKILSDPCLPRERAHYQDLQSSSPLFAGIVLGLKHVDAVCQLHRREGDVCRVCTIHS